ncbi:MAG: hypothetical protein JWR80_9483 [Bradyrhizobium sp.]|nr:hypothetical protein [Bradyrhizobium sp.]
MAKEEAAPPEEVVEAPEPGKEPVQEAEQQEEETAPPTIEDIAAKAGWSPKDQWRGSEDDWVDATTFVTNTVDINKALKRDLKATRESSERAARAAATITERAVENERQSLLQARQEAFDTGDGATFDRASQRLQSLPRVQQEVPADSTDSREFMQRNSSWYGIDPVASQIAYNVCEREARKGADFSTQLQAAETEVRKRFPEMFADARPGKGPAQLEASGSRTAGYSRKGAKGFNDLPPEAKRAALEFKKRGRCETDEYARIYWEENA